MRRTKADLLTNSSFSHLPSHHVARGLSQSRLFDQGLFLKPWQFSPLPLLLQIQPLQALLCLSLQAQLAHLCQGCLQGLCVCVLTIQLLVMQEYPMCVSQKLLFDRRMSAWRVCADICQYLYTLYTALCRRPDCLCVCCGADRCRSPSLLRPPSWPSPPPAQPLGPDVPAPPANAARKHCFCHFTTNVFWTSLTFRPFFK